MESYEKLLDKAYSQIPKDVLATERFEIPKVTGRIEGNKTIINNFLQIVSAFHRDQNHLLKYLQRELATSAWISGQRLFLGRKISPDLINKKIETYANEFVLCKECKKPDTKLITEGDALFVRCSACGSKNKIKSKI